MRLFYCLHSAPYVDSLHPRISLGCWRISRGLNVFKKEKKEIALIPFLGVVFDTRRYLSLLEPRALWVADWTALTDSTAVDDQIMPTFKEGRWISPIRRIFPSEKR